MENFNIPDLISDETWANLIKSGIFLLIAVPIIIAVRRYLRTFITKKYGAHYGLLIAKIFFYSMLTITFVVVLHQMGYQLGPLLGAAGIVGIAIGFASQTSVSNIISGFFLIAEKPFQVGDVITIGTTTGIVLSIDTLSVKLRTFDNKFVRIPNELIIKTEVMNVTRFPIRRVDMPISVAYKEDINRVKELLFEIAEKNPLALQEPEPIINFVAYGASSIDLSFNVWCAKEDFLNVRNQIQEEVKRKFDEIGIEIPFPHSSIYAGEASKPIPVQLLGLEGLRWEEEKE
ncbi:MAG TPA: mechanosensitive ion channel family protein [Bacteroidetes bacterium]|nr:mechanosensitive ion channel family protein [Bacteroidota bacterium]